METPEEIAKQWGLNIIGQSLIPRTEAALRQIQAKNALDVYDLRQLIENGIPVVGALESYLHNNAWHIKARVLANDIDYETLIKALNIEYVRINNSGV